MALLETRLDRGDLGAEPLRARSRRRALLEALGLLLGAIAILYVTLVPMGRVTGVVKIPLVLLAFVPAYLACDRAGKALFGPGFDTGFWLSAAWLTMLILATTMADLLPLGNYQDTAKAIFAPGNVAPDLFSDHPLGTNNFGLDLLARSIYGARVSLLAPTFAVVLSILIGGTLGVIAGYRRGWLDHGIGLFTDATLAFPPLVLLIALAAVLGHTASVVAAILKGGAALAVVTVPAMLRIARANTLSVSQREFVLAARAMGARDTRIIIRELVPNIVLSMLSYALVVMAVLIVAESALAYLGLGLQEPSPTWGNMIAEGGLTELRQYPFIPLVPGVFLLLTVFSFNRIGEWARGRWDPRSSAI